MRCLLHSVRRWDVLQSQLAADETGIFLCTAHPAKFKESVEEILNITLPLPKELADRAELPLLSAFMPADFTKLREFLLA
jgi:threonine synthase